ncbi:anti-sigma factor [Citreicella sp. C3M06]|uniref:anti-sigma factor n=1 Tax=Citreicella sp. C3M06 TaxID=2841564 RepID=UPI001C084841|nr:anti-sigma factor [Citreicella sp. C3M06]MBU2960961.1 anti-sigma factor [Citreicella sp. C3M06]
MMLSDDDIALAGEYVLGAMDRAERSAIEARMRSDSAFAAEIARWELRLDPMLAEIPPEAPPALAWEALEDRLFAPPKRPAWAWFGFAGGLSTLLLGAVLWFGAPMQRQQGPLWISDLVSSDGQVRLAALYDEQRGEMRVSVGGDAPQQGRDFELWLIAGEAAPVSLGVMPRSGAAAMPIPDDLRALMAGATLAITDEPAGGSPQGRATGPVVALAPLRRI